MGLDIQLLEQSFEQIKPRADEVSTTFYQTLFADYPQVQPLFAHSKMDEQRQKLIKSLVLIIEALRRPEDLNSMLKGLGARHVQYGVLPQHYPMVGSSLLKTFEVYLGSDWTIAVQNSWTEAYEAIAQLMLEGAEYSPEVIRLEDK